MIAEGEKGLYAVSPPVAPVTAVLGRLETRGPSKGLSSEASEVLALFLRPCSRSPHGPFRKGDPVSMAPSVLRGLLRAVLPVALVPRSPCAERKRGFAAGLSAARRRAALGQGLPSAPQVSGPAGPPLSIPAPQGVGTRGGRRGLNN